MNLSDRIIKFLRSKGHLAVKRHGGPFGSAGEPDIDAWLWYSKSQPWAIPVRIEVKRDAKDKPRSIQSLRMMESQARGVACYVIWDIGHAKEMEQYWRTMVESMTGGQKNAR